MKAISKMKQSLKYLNSRFVVYLKLLAVVLLSSKTVIVFGKTTDNPPIAGYIKINIQYKQAQPNDTITLLIDEILHDGNGIEFNNLGSYKAGELNGQFSFLVPVNQSCGYFTILKERTFTKKGGGNDNMPLMNTCFWEVGDNVTIRLSHRETYSGIYSICAFSGKGSIKYKVAQHTDSILYATVVHEPKPVFDTAFNYFDFYPDKCKRALDILEQNHKGLSDLAHQVLRANILYGAGDGRFDLVSTYYNKYIKNASVNVKAKFKRKLNEVFANNDTYHLSETALLNSSRFIECTYYKFKTLSYINNDEDNEQLVFNLMKRRLTGNIRDKEIVFLLLNYFKSTNLSNLYAEAHKIVRDSISVSILDKLIDNAPGKAFVSFDLPETTGKLTGISKFKGRVVLIDFWFNGCGGCALLYQKALKEAELTFKDDKQVVFASINCDKSKRRWLNGIEAGIYTSDEATNLYTNGLGAIHPIVTSNSVLNFPFVFLLDKNGVIKYINSTNLYNSKELIAAIKSAE